MRVHLLDTVKVQCKKLSKNFAVIPGRLPKFSSILVFKAQYKKLSKSLAVIPDRLTKIRCNLSIWLNQFLAKSGGWYILFLAGYFYYEYDDHACNKDYSSMIGRLRWFIPIVAFFWDIEFTGIFVSLWKYLFCWLTYNTWFFRAWELLKTDWRDQLF